MTWSCASPRRSSTRSCSSRTCGRSTFRGGRWWAWCTSPAAACRMRPRYRRGFSAGWRTSRRIRRRRANSCRPLRRWAAAGGNQGGDRARRQRQLADAVLEPHAAQLLRLAGSVRPRHTQRVVIRLAATELERQIRRREILIDEEHHWIALGREHREAHQAVAALLLL